MAIIGVLSSVVYASIAAVRANSRDNQRRQNLTEIQSALETFYVDNGHYPNTGGLSNVYSDTSCNFTGSGDVSQENWIPGLVDGGYLLSLPEDPLGEDQTGNFNDGACYMYASDGDDYLLTAGATVENYVQDDDELYSRANFREPVHNRNDALYFCNHPNFKPGYVDLYHYSYTVTTLDCSW